MLTFEAYNNYKSLLEKQSKLQNLQSSAVLEAVDSQDSSEDELMANAKDDVERCIAVIMGKFKFFGEFIYNCRFLYTYKVPTMATDGKNIFVNPKFCGSLTDKQIVFVLCHEVLHNVMIHFLREKAHNVDDHERWNYAADYEINPMLVQEGLIDANELKNEMKGCYEEKYLDKTAEEIYDELGAIPKPPPPPKEPAAVGDYVHVKKPKDAYGKVTHVNADGSYEIEECTKEEAHKAVMGK